MKNLRIASFAVVGLLFATNAFAQSKSVDAEYKMSLHMPGESGTNGLAVTYNPSKQLYYVGFAGNSDFPLVVFNKSGEVTNSSLTTEFDMRGLWYNESTKQLQGIQHRYAGEDPLRLYTRPINSDGNPGTSTYKEYKKKPRFFDQGVAVFNSMNNTVVFREDNTVYFYNPKKFTPKGTLKLDLSTSSWENINYNTVVYTGVKGEEYGILDFVNRKIFLFNGATGKLSKAAKLPADAPTPQAFNFSYANGMFWIQDTDNRTWSGYSVS